MFMSYTNVPALREEMLPIMSADFVFACWRKRVSHLTRKSRNTVCELFWCWASMSSNLFGRNSVLPTKCPKKLAGRTRKARTAVLMFLAARAGANKSLCDPTSAAQRRYVMSSQIINAEIQFAGCFDLGHPSILIFVDTAAFRYLIQYMSKHSLRAVLNIR